MLRLLAPDPKPISSGDTLRNGAGVGVGVGVGGVLNDAALLCHVPDTPVNLTAARTWYRELD